MRTLPILVFITLLCCAFTHAKAWDRGTVDNHISKLCEQRNPDDWPGQDDCIAVQRRALQSLRPPRDDQELVATYKACKDAASDEYDFAAVYHCYQGRSSTIVADRAAAAEIAAKKELATLFPTLPVIVQCSFSDGRRVEIRRNDKNPSAIVAKVSPEALFVGRSGVGYSYEWGGAQGIGFKLDGNQLMDRSGGTVKLFMGKCDYR